MLIERRSRVKGDACAIHRLSRLAGECSVKNRHQGGQPQQRERQ
jgi:hypothetical protein